MSIRPYASHQGRPYVLSIAGSDPSGGAGIQADLKTFESLGVEGGAVPTALTVQNSRVVARIEPLPAELVAEQIEVVFAEARVRAVKIGMLATADIVNTVADAIRRHRPPFVVLDPVMRSTSGRQLLSDDGIDALRRNLLAVVSLVAPNAMEAGELIGCPAPRDVRQARTTASRIRSLGVPAVVVTGGHIDNDASVVDVLVSDAGAVEARTPRVSTSRTHGTGCRFSSAVAAYVALGLPLVEACAAAQHYVAASLEA